MRGYDGHVSGGNQRSQWHRGSTFLHLGRYWLDFDTLNTVHTIPQPWHGYQPESISTPLQSPRLHRHLPLS